MARVVGVGRPAGSKKRRSASRFASSSPQGSAVAGRGRLKADGAQRRNPSEGKGRKMSLKRRSLKAGGSANSQQKNIGRPKSGNMIRPYSPERGATAGAQGRTLITSGRSRPFSRAVRDAYVSRIQRWFRSLVLRGVVRCRGLLVMRIREILELEQRLWELRVRMAKRVLSEAFNTYALTLHSDSERRGLKKYKPVVTLVNAFMHAKKDCLLRSEKLHIIYQRAVKVIEGAWTRCVLFRSIQQASVENKMQCLLIQQEEIERRDYIRQRWLFLVECHQQCYNHPLLVKAKIAVRSTECWASVLMESTLHLPDRSCSFVNLNNEVTLDVSSAQDFRHSMMMPTSRSQTPSRFASPNFGQTSDSQRWSCLNEERCKGLISPTTHEQPSVKHRFHLQADTAFVHGLLQEMGKLDFPSSMGSRPRVLVSPRDLTDNRVSTTCTARVQSTEHASELTNSRCLWVGNVLLRECLRPLPLFKEFFMLTRSKERGWGKGGKATSSSYVSGDAVNASFLHPAPTKKSRERTLSPMDFSVSVASMGKAWADFYVFMDLAGDALRSLSCNNTTSDSSLLAPLMVSRRSKGYLFARSGGRALLHVLSGTGVASVTQTSGKFRTPIPTSAEQTQTTWTPTEVLGSEFDIKYEIERLLVREFHRRLKLQALYDAEVAALGWVIQRGTGTTRNVGEARTKVKESRQHVKKARVPLHVPPTLC
ncbi:hypothetical protein MOQ_003688 [Trypanosoma cruzi marinkellei]|uniref:Uncharacterized protein n=1 Tax=Trypanosoma cruzi marinkellei TaxID=85056 RepID=K2MBB3_TRYCR|nr:hypothetical protein MOQ_003688 [Trypanosoma cruzi marinkellei]